MFAVPLAFLRLQRKNEFFSTLVTFSGDALFGNISSFPSEWLLNKEETILVNLKKEGETFLLKPATKDNVQLQFTEPTGIFYIFF